MFWFAFAYYSSMYGRIPLVLVGFRKVPSRAAHTTLGKRKRTLVLTGCKGSHGFVHSRTSLVYNTPPPDHPPAHPPHIRHPPPLTCYNQFFPSPCGQHALAMCPYVSFIWGAPGGPPRPRPLASRWTLTGKDIRKDMPRSGREGEEREGENKDGRTMAGPMYCMR